MVKQIFIGFCVFIIQFLLVDFLSINMIRPDFMVIFIFYFSLNNDGYKSILLGFILGLLCDLSGVGSNFGLNSLTLSITAYLTSFLNGKYERLLPYVFHLLWIFILALHFFIISFIQFQTLYESNFLDFLLKFIFTFAYSMMFFIVVQFFFPVKEASRA
ncbi:MAG: rod shape-determining protein MreD [Dehalococcoidales bacterium]|nr:rod shape-determining protein MreD [Candidatus Neomarinimicrobiota bacterium]MBT7881212.1 rod shape-determining protein MreD [Flavobacteriaceae bacterium]NCG34528.1 rod shape-determining protein MreD [Dehalococcoidales bacterium]